MSGYWDYGYRDHITLYYSCALCDWYRSSTFSSQHLKDDLHQSALNRYGSSLYSKGCGRYYCDLCRCSIFSENNILPHVRGLLHQYLMGRYRSNYSTINFYNDLDSDESEYPPYKKFKRQSRANSYSSLPVSVASSSYYQNCGNLYYSSSQSWTLSRNHCSTPSSYCSSRSKETNRSRKREWALLERY